MKKLIAFLMVTALTAVSTAAPAQKLNYGKVVSKINHQVPFASFLKSQKSSFGLNFEVREINEKTLEFKADGQTLVLEDVDGTHFKINGEVIQISQNESGKSVLNKINRALRKTSRQVSWIEALFFPEAKAIGTLGVLALMGLAGFIAYRIGVNIERNRWIRAALAPRPAVVEETTITEGLLPAFQ